MSSRLFLALEDGAVLITEHSKQAEQFRLSFAQWKRSQGITAWATPTIASWSEWLKGMAEDLLWMDSSNNAEALSLLSPLQEQTVWEQVIRAEVNHPLMHLPSTAALARQAWGLIHSWRLSDTTSTQFPSDDVRSYSKWVSDYMERCKNSAWIDQARLPDVLKLAINNGQIKVPQQLILAGFLKLTPQQTELMSAIKQLGTQVSLYTPEPREAALVGHSYVSIQEEFRAIALWCKELIEQNPELSIAIAIPNLEQNRAELDYILRKTLYPGSFSSEEEFINNAYQLSVGENLADSEVANMAMNLLELIEGQFSFDQISQILRNPYCSGDSAETIERLKIDAWLRQKGVLEFDLVSFIDLLKLYRKEKTSDEYSSEHSAEPKITSFEASLIKLETSSGLTKNRYTPSIWAKHFHTHLDSFGWPQSDLNSTEQAHALTMQSCLSEFATLNFVQGTIDFSLAIASLRRLYQNKQLGSAQSSAPIQILDLKQIHALSFDHLWVAQLSDRVLPESSQTNPLIPYDEQCKLQITGATPELRLQEALLRIAHLRHAARQVIFSYANDGATEQEQAPAMLRDIEFTAQQLESVVSQDKLACEWVEESYGPAYKNTRSVGTSLFKYQAECPFKAFAKTRLLPSTPDKASHGLTALERGSLLHSALEMLWLRFKNSGTLQSAQQTENFESQVSDIIVSVITDFEKKLNYTLSHRLKTIEQARLVKLTLAWLELESERAPFEVHRREYKTEVEINGLQVKGRIDRIDKINDIGFAIIDYKSGVQTAGAWFDDRPDQPQMPIYALAERNNLVAIVYANLKPGDMGFNGLSEKSELFPAIKAFDDLPPNRRHEMTWNELIPYWREQLNALAHDYKKGLAVPDPKKGLATCKYCELETLCRVNASGNVPTVLDDYESIIA